MTSFDETKVRRGQPANKAQFAEKENTAPDADVLAAGTLSPAALLDAAREAQSVNSDQAAEEIARNIMDDPTGTGIDWRTYRPNEEQVFDMMSRAVRAGFQAGHPEKRSPSSQTGYAPPPLNHVHRAKIQLLVDEMFSGDEPVLFVPATPHGDGYSDAIAFNDDKAVKFTGNPDGDLEHYPIRNASWSGGGEQPDLSSEPWASQVTPGELDAIEKHVRLYFTEEPTFFIPEDGLQDGHADIIAYDGTTAVKITAHDGNALSYVVGS